MNFNKRTVLNNVLKAILFFFLIFILYRQVAHSDMSIEEGLLTLWQAIRKIEPLYFVLVFLLMPVNWLIETRRYQLMMHHYVDIDFTTSLRCILGGLSLASISPNRIGEYGGRLLALRPEYNRYGLLTTFAGSIAQNLINLIFGLLGGLYFLQKYMSVSSTQLMMVSILVIAFSLLMGILYYHLDWLSKLIAKWSRIPRISKLVTALNQTKDMGSSLLTKVLAYSILRYLTYTSQYVLMLYAFDFDISMLSAFAGVAFIYLVQSGLPIPPLFGLLARAEIALLVWGVFVDNELVIITATLLLWIINLILPALIGFIVVFNTDIIKSLGFAKNNHNSNHGLG